MLHFETEPKLDLKIVSLASSIHAECRGPEPKSWPFPDDWGGFR